MASPLGELRLEMTANAATFARDLSKAATSLDSLSKDFGKLSRSAETSGNLITRSVQRVAAVITSARAAVIGLVGVVAAGKIATSFQATADAIENIGRTSRLLKIPADQLSALKFVADDAGVPFESLAKLLAKSQKNLSELAGEINGKTDPAIVRLVRESRDLGGQLRPVADLLPIIARNLSALDTGARLSLSEKIFGREGGTSFLALLDELEGRLEDLPGVLNEVRRLGAVVTDDQVAKIREYNDAILRLSTAWTGLKIRVVETVAPALTKTIDQLTNRLTEIPGVLRGLGFQLEQLFSGDSIAASESFSKLAQLGKSFGIAVGTSILQTAKAAGVTIIEAVVLAYEAAAPTLTDITRDILAPVIEPIAEKLGLTFQKSLRGQLRDAASEFGKAVEDSVDLEDKVERLQNLVSKSIGGKLAFSIDLSLAKDALSDAREKIASNSELVQRIRKLSTDVEQQARDRIANLSKAAQTAAESTGVVWRESIAEISNAWEDFRSRLITAGKTGPEIPSDVSAFVGPIPDQAALERAAEIERGIVGRLRAGIDALSGAVANAKKLAIDLADSIVSGAEKFGRNAELEVRRLAALGQTGDSERLKLLAKQTTELAKARSAAIKSLNAEDAAYLSKLNEVLSAERKRLEVDQTIADVVSKISDAERGFRQSLEDTQRAVELGTRSQIGARAEIESGASALAKFAESYRDVVAAIRAANPEIDANVFRQVEDAIASAERTAKSAGESIGKSLEAGFQDAFVSIAKSVRSISDLSANVLETSISGLTTGLAGAITSSEASFRNFGKSVLSVVEDVTRSVANLVIQFYLTRAILGGLEAVFPGSFAGLKGAGFGAGGVKNNAAGAVITRPIAFLSGGRVNRAGEAGPEALIPLDRLSSMISAGGGGTTVNVFDQRSGGAPVETQQRTGPDGRKVLEVFVRDAVKSGIRNGAFDKDFGRFGMRPRALPG